jgi:cytoskeletal protein CcmA (bactofilin family)
MGLFGRDERTDLSKPSHAEPQPHHHAAQPGGGAITLIAKANRVEGQIKGSGEVRIEGFFKGKLDCPTTVFVAQGGEVEAELRASIVTVAGIVRGNAFATDKIELTPSADMHGDITAPRILIREGATFEGQVFMKDPSKRGPAKPDEKDKTGKNKVKEAPEKEE